MKDKIHILHSRATADKSRKGTRNQFSRARKRLREVERLLQDRHGGHVPATDDHDLYLAPVANCFRKIAADCGRPADMERLFQFWCSEHAPDLSNHEVSRVAREAIAQPPRLITDDIVGAILRLSYEDRRRLKITAIGSFDVDRAGRRKLAKGRRRDRDRVGAKARRKANGATPREESLSRTKPWKALGISRSTWERRRRKAAEGQASTTDANSSPHHKSDGDANSSPHLLSIHARRNCVMPERLQRDGAAHWPIVIESKAAADRRLRYGCAASTDRADFTALAAG